MLQEHRPRQLEERLAAGSGWSDGNYIFTNEVGEPLRPDHLTDRHAKRCKAAGLEHVRLHDLRHTAASLMLSNGANVRVVADLMGHSDPALTLRVYTHSLPGATDKVGEQLTASLGL